MNACRVHILRKTYFVRSGGRTYVTHRSNGDVTCECVRCCFVVLARREAYLMKMRTSVYPDFPTDTNAGREEKKSHHIGIGCHTPLAGALGDVIYSSKTAVSRVLGWITSEPVVPTSKFSRRKEVSRNAQCMVGLGRG